MSAMTQVQQDQIMNLRAVGQSIEEVAENVEIEEDLVREYVESVEEPAPDFRALLDFGEGTDDFFARHVANGLEGKVLVSPESGEVFGWNGTIWQPDRIRKVDSDVREFLADIAEVYDKKRKVATSKEERAWLRSLIRGLLSGGRQATIFSMVKADPRLTAEMRTFDCEPYLLATPSGEIDLRTGKLQEADPAHRITQSTTSHLGGGYHDTRFSQFMEEITDGDEDLSGYFQKILGAALIGNIEIQEFYIFEGGGGNGKDTLLEIVGHVVGDYMSRAISNMLIAKKHEEHSAEVFALRGKRIVVHSESDRGKKLDIGRVKEFTGTPVITARAMRQNPVEFTNTWTHILSTNHLPTITGDSEDYGLARRIVVVPFPVKFLPVDHADWREGVPTVEIGLAAKIIDAEDKEVLAWLVEGAKAYFDEGLARPTIVVEATSQYIEDNADQYGIWHWLEQRTVQDAEAFTPFVDLMQDYTLWLSENPNRAASDRTLGMRLSKHGYSPGKQRIEVHGEAEKVEYRGRYGIRLKTSEDDPTTMDDILNAEVQR